MGRKRLGHHLWQADSDRQSAETALFNHDSVNDVPRERELVVTMCESSS